MPARVLAAAAILLAAISSPSAHSRHSRSWKVEETSSRTQTIPVESARRIVVDDVYGDVSVRGYGGREIRMKVTETIRARDKEGVELARREVSLDVDRRSDEVTICANGPFREPDDCTEWRRHRDDDWDYMVVYDLELEIPREIDLKVRTVDGDIDVSGVSGQFRVNGVNGSVSLASMRGFGEVRTVNGSLKVGFDENPTDNCTFDTVNGAIEVGFEPGLSADLTFKTMNGEVKTDFDYETLPPEPIRVETRRGGTKFRIEATSGIRIASGGPRFEFENINGDILIRRNQ